jgi:hypothetical protein
MSFWKAISSRMSPSVSLPGLRRRDDLDLRDLS